MVRFKYECLLIMKGRLLENKFRSFRNAKNKTQYRRYSNLSKHLEKINILSELEEFYYKLLNLYMSITIVYKNFVSVSPNS